MMLIMFFGVIREIQTNLIFPLIVAEVVVDFHL